MAHVFQLTEWQGASGRWFCADTQNLTAKYPQWMVPVRLLGMAPADYVKMLVETFHADVRYYPDNTYLSVSWKNQADMRKFKNFVNQKARQANYLI